ncbi:hypothetical protein, partial [Parvibaculum sp.]|uniref:hypothetical protein n=1 Tax=Parvibaculum sp. TaxID=2024848 RepID=UPI00349FF997
MSPKALPATAPTIIDFGVVESGIRERETDSVPRNRAFCKLVLETIFGVPGPEVEEYIVDGGGDRGIDIAYIDHANRRINLGSCKAVVNFRNSKKNFPGDEVDKISSFVDDLLLNREELLLTCNGALAAKVREIWEIFGNEAYTVAVHLFSNQLTLEREARKRLASSLERHEIGLLEYGLFELSHGIVRATKPRFQKKLTPSSDSALCVSEGENRALVTRVRLDELATFLNTQNRTFDERLVWQNVRYFLGLDNEVNREIRETLLSGRLRKLDDLSDFGRTGR